MHLVGIFQSSKYKNVVGYIVEDGSNVNSFKFYWSFERNGVGIYQSLEQIDLTIA